MKKILLCLITIILIACTLKINTTINFSDIISAENKMLIADLRISVPSCSDENIKDIQNALEKRNIKATYNKCSSDDDLWNEYASFSLPITLVKGAVETNTEHSDIYFQYVDGGLYLKTSSKLAKLLDSSDNLFEDKMNISSIEFSLINDTSNKITIKPLLVFVNGKPIYEKKVDIQSLNKVLIKIPDVASQLLEQSDAEYLLFRVVEQ